MPVHPRLKPVCHPSLLPGSAADHVEELGFSAACHTATPSLLWRVQMSRAKSLHQVSALSRPHPSVGLRGLSTCLFQGALDGTGSGHLRGRSLSQPPPPRPPGSSPAWVSLRGKLARLAAGRGWAFSVVAPQFWNAFPLAGGTAPYFASPQWFLF